MHDELHSLLPDAVYLDSNATFRRTNVSSCRRPARSPAPPPCWTRPSAHRLGISFIFPSRREHTSTPSSAASRSPSLAVPPGPRLSPAAPSSRPSVAAPCSSSSGATGPSSRLSSAAPTSSAAPPSTACGTASRLSCKPAPRGPRLGVAPKLSSLVKNNLRPFLPTELRLRPPPPVRLRPFPLATPPSQLTRSTSASSSRSGGSTSYYAHASRTLTQPKSPRRSFPCRPRRPTCRRLRRLRLHRLRLHLRPPRASRPGSPRHPRPGLGARRALPRETDLPAHRGLQHRPPNSILQQGMHMRRQHGLSRTLPPPLRVPYQIPCDPWRLPWMDGDRHQDPGLLERRRPHRRLPGRAAYLCTNSHPLQRLTRSGGGFLNVARGGTRDRRRPGFLPRLFFSPRTPGHDRQRPVQPQFYLLPTLVCPLWMSPTTQ
jgi:hypothetical protein